MLKKEGSKKKIILQSMLAAVLLTAVIVGGFLYNESKTEYDSVSKSAISMGTIVTAKTYGENTGPENETVISSVNQLDKLISWREEGSLTQRLNKTNFINSPELADIVSICNKVSEESDGAFDLTVGELSNLWGIGTENERLPEKAEIEKALEKVGYKSLEVNGAEVRSEKGQFVDLGAVGKGYACDMIKAYLETTELKGAVVSVGGSILAFGNRNKAGDKWRIAVRDPRNEQGYIGVVKMDEGFVSTSGDYEKYFEKDGKRYHHLLDPRTGYPSDNGLVSVTIVCDSGILSDALSTACFVLGKEKGSELAEKYGVGAIFIDEEMNITTVGDVDFERE